MECLSTRGSEPILPARWSLLALLLALSACQGTPTPEESSARKSIQAAESDFRPNGAPPPRIELTPQSPPEDYIRYAIYRNPKVEERFHLWSQAVEQITLARSLPDPSLTFSSEIGRMIESFGPGFTQTLPSRDRLVLAAEAQSHAASARRLEFEREVFRTASRIRTLYFEGAYLEQAITINREILGIATEVETLATSRFRVAQVTLQDVLRPQIERDQIDYEILSLLDSRNTLAARLKEALGMPPDEPDPPLPATLLPSLTGAVEVRSRRRVLVVAGLAAAAAAVLALAVPAVLDPADTPVSGPGTSTSSPQSPGSPDGGPTVETHEMAALGDVPVEASLGLERVAWGTRMLLTCTYDKDAVEVELPEQVDYLLFVTASDGRSEQVGSWTSLSGATMEVPAATSVRRDDIASVEVRTTSGRVVLRLDA